MYLGSAMLVLFLTAAGWDWQIAAIATIIYMSAIMNILMLAVIAHMHQETEKQSSYEEGYSDGFKSCARHSTVFMHTMQQSYSQSVEEFTPAHGQVYELLEVANDRLSSYYDRCLDQMHKDKDENPDSDFTSGVELDH